MGPEGVRVEVIDLDDHDPAAGAGMLDGAERERAAALRSPSDRRRYVAAHIGLRRLLGEATGQGADSVVILRSACTSCGRPHGKPYVEAGPSFSLSRSGRWAVVALSTTAAVGVDIEEVQDSARLAPLGETLLAPHEDSSDLLRTWVRKEALLKATGQGLTAAMTSVRADDPRIVDLGEGLPDGVVGAVATLFTGASHPSAKVRRR